MIWFKFCWYYSIDHDLHYRSRAAITIQFSFISISGFNCCRCTVDELINSRTSVRCTTGPKDFRLFLLRPLSARNRLLLRHDAIRQFAEHFSFLLIYFVCYVVYELLPPRISRAADRQIARFIYFVSATQPVMVGRGRRVWWDLEIFAGDLGDEEGKRSWVKKDILSWSDYWHLDSLFYWSWLMHFFFNAVDASQWSLRCGQLCTGAVAIFTDYWPTVPKYALIGKES